MIDALLDIYGTYRPEEGAADKRNEQLRSLSDEQFAYLSEVLLQHIQSGQEAQIAIAEDVVSDLVIHTSYSVDLLLRTMLQVGYAPLDHLFRAAGPHTEAELLAMLEKKDRPELVMSALAWIDREEITDRFAQWKRKETIALLDLYMFNAGWELDANYQKRWLFKRSCFGLKAASKQIGSSASSIIIDEKCRWCDRPLYSLSDFPTTYLEKLFDLASTVRTLSIPFCMYCTLFEPVPMSLKPANDGKVDFSPRIAEDKRIEQPNYKLETCGGILHLEIAGSMRDCFSAVDSGRSYNLSQIGGFPTWPQDANFPHCVECGQTMLFFMQVESMDFPVLQYEGVYHFFVCQSCSSEFAVQQSN
ncbi:MAG: hypothetical protein C0508_05375 [Cyanobacteria bacterium PR.023]|nr:hypothetical protein [Cyanobacteria bacterium PR.023]